MKNQKKVRQQKKSSEVSNLILGVLILATGLIVLYYCAFNILTFGSKLVWIHLQEGYFKCVGFASHASYETMFQELENVRAEMYRNGTAVQQLFYISPVILKILFYGVSWFVFIQPIRIIVKLIKRRKHNRPEGKTR